MDRSNQAFQRHHNFQPHKYDFRAWKVIHDNNCVLKSAMRNEKNNQGF